MKIVGFIPARYGSTRLEGKPLVDICGKPMIQWVCERSSKSKLLDKVIVLTEDRRIFDKVKGLGYEAMITSKKCKSGTERIISVLDKVKCDIAINIQGDEPLIHPNDIDKCVTAIKSSKDVKISTIARLIKDKSMLDNPNVVKVVMDKNNNSLYFSRSKIPFDREKNTKTKWYQHIGLYGYRREILKEFPKLHKGFLKDTESLEQLIFLENGYKIKVELTNNITYSIDTKEDVLMLEKFLKKKI